MFVPEEKSRGLSSFRQVSHKLQGNSSHCYWVNRCRLSVTKGIVNNGTSYTKLHIFLYMKSLVGEILLSVFSLICIAIFINPSLKLNCKGSLKFSTCLKDFIIIIIIWFFFLGCRFTFLDVKQLLKFVELHGCISDILLCHFTCL